MKKTVLWVLGITAAVLLTGFLILTLSLDGLVKSTIEETSTELLDTEVEVAGVSISILDGSGTIDGWVIYNPDGFTERPAMSFKQISMQVDLSTILSDTVVVSNVVIQQPEIYVEQTADGNNLKTLQDNLASYSSEDSYEGVLVIDHVLIEEGNVELKSTVGEVRTVQANIGRIELNDVGREGNNTTEQTVKQILEPVITQAIKAALKTGIQDAVEDTIKDLFEG